ncbi:MAG TPA: cation/multidrug efflux pump [Gammaproteobacteria bacterium]|nr:cation/multidrug efflux pump [Gammaproteobacteria bacterium]
MDSSGITLYIGAAVLAILAIIGLVWFISGLARLLHGRFFNGPIRSLAGLVLMLVMAFITLLVLDLRTYFSLTHEQLVATVRFDAIGPQYFHALLTDASGHVIQTDLHGDEWQLDARVIKWSGFATLLGLQTRYHLDRLSGRYRDVAQERNAIHSAISLAPDSWLDSWTLMQRYALWLPWADASYGSATYLPMVDGGEYQVTLSTTGLVARPVNSAAQQATARW